MKKDEVLFAIRYALDELSIREGEYIVVYGAAMVLRDIKENCTDIDITLTTNAFDRIIVNHGLISAKYSPEENHFYTHYGCIDFFRGSTGCMIENIEGTMTSNNLIVQTIDSLRTEKHLRGREKDKRDVALIDDFIRKSSKSYFIGRN